MYTFMYVRPSTICDQVLRVLCGGVVGCSSYSEYYGFDLQRRGRMCCFLDSWLEMIGCTDIDYEQLRPNLYLINYYLFISTDVL
jgi:hypothetical protein